MAHCASLRDSSSRLGRRPDQEVDGPRRILRRRRRKIALQRGHLRVGLGGLRPARRRVRRTPSFRLLAPGSVPTSSCSPSKRVSRLCASRPCSRSQRASGAAVSVRHPHLRRRPSPDRAQQVGPVGMIRNHEAAVEGPPPARSAYPHPAGNQAGRDFPKPPQPGRAHRRRAVPQSAPGSREHPAWTPRAGSPPVATPAPR